MSACCFLFPQGGQARIKQKTGPPGEAGQADKIGLNGGLVRRKKRDSRTGSDQTEKRSASGASARDHLKTAAADPVADFSAKSEMLSVRVDTLRGIAPQHGAAARDDMNAVKTGMQSQE